MATNKELKAAAKQAKKDIVARNKKEEEEKIAKSQRTLLAIKTQKDPVVEVVEEVKKTPTKSKKITEEEEIEELKELKIFVLDDSKTVIDFIKKIFEYYGMKNPKTSRFRVN